MEKELFRALQRDGLFSCANVGMTEITKFNREKKLSCWHPTYGELANGIYLYSFDQMNLPVIDVVCRTIANCELYLMNIGKKSKYVTDAKTLYSEKNGFCIENAY